MMAGSHAIDCPRHPAIEHEPALDGTTGGPVLETEVDGEKARVKVTNRKSESDDDAGEATGITRLPPPPIEDSALIATLQKAVDDKVIFAIKQALTKSVPCEYEWYDRASDQSVGCEAAAVFDVERKATCPTCQNTETRKSDKLCIAHMSLRASEILEERQTELDFEGDGE